LKNRKLFLKKQECDKIKRYEKRKPKRMNLNDVLKIKAKDWPLSKEWIEMYKTKLKNNE